MNKDSHIGMTINGEAYNTAIECPIALAIPGMTAPPTRIPTLANPIRHPVMVERYLGSWVISPAVAP